MCQTDECCCGYSGHHTPGRASHHYGGCCTPDYPLRHFPTREETISQLEEYLKNLQAEAKGVDERIAELKQG
jgi:hypothetical protein